MKKLWAVVAIAAVIAGLFLLLRSKNPAPANPPAQTGSVPAENSRPPSAQAGPQSVPVAPPIVGTANPNAATQLASRAASPNPVPEQAASPNEEFSLAPAIALDKARVVVANYRSAFGEDPVGTNPEITAALMGKNSKHINFVADSSLHVDDKGNLLDAYGTPFFFHQISGQVMEIRSAGPDRIMWTQDDLVTR